MPPWDVAPLVMGMTVTLAIAGVLILRPLAKHIGKILEMRASQRYERPELSDEDLSRLTDAVSRLADRLETLEERQDFTERLLDAQRPGSRAHLAKPHDSPDDR
jgi:hypothetical protein